MTRLSDWLDDLRHATVAAERAEGAFRADFARRVAELATERAVAHRRVNLMRAVADAVAGCEDEGSAAAHGLAVLRARLGWAMESEARAEIVERFAPVCAAAFAALAEKDEAADPAAALAAFETWYHESRGSAFWVLFENPMPETPLVDF